MGPRNAVWPAAFSMPSQADSRASSPGAEAPLRAAAPVLDGLPPHPVAASRKEPHRNAAARTEQAMVRLVEWGEPGIVYGSFFYIGVPLGSATASRMRKQQATSAGKSSRAIMLGPSLKASSGRGCVSKKIPSQPQATAARAR